MRLQPGSRLGPYEVIELAGAGGMGEVYKARDVRLGRTVALKTVTSAGDEDPGARKRLAREARAVAALNHPHICGIHDVGEWEGRTFLVMEFLEGETLQQRLVRGAMKVDELLTVAIQTGRALVAAHREGVVHRDLKPSNIMLTRGGVKLLDFGIAQQRPSLTVSAATEMTLTAPETLSGQFAGTAPYMAPEQLEGKPVDLRADIYAFGAVLFEMATGERAFKGTTSAAVAAAILGQSRPSLADRAPDIPRSVERIVSVCLALDRDERWQHSTDLLRELRWAFEDLGSSAPAAATTRKRRRWAAHALWAGAVLGSAAVAWVLGGRGKPVEPPLNTKPVVVLMDSPLPGRVYDPRTAASGGTNADDVTDVLRVLPVAILKENTSALWHREEQVIAERPDLIVAHLSCLFDARVPGNQKDIYDHLFGQAQDRLMLFLAYVAARNPRTQFIVYSRSVFREAGGEQQWVAGQAARMPILQGRLQAFTVPGADTATFRNPDTARLLRSRVAQALRLPEK